MDIEALEEILVLHIGLVRTGQLDREPARRWTPAASVGSVPASRMAMAGALASGRACTAVVSVSGVARRLARQRGGKKQVVSFHRREWVGDGLDFGCGGLASRTVVGFPS